jgi:hypothetical protein
MPTVKTITFSYRPKEDRLLAGINLGQPDVWACWLTRRLSLAVVAGWKKFLADTSRLAQQTASDHRQELAEFERAGRHRQIDLADAGAGRHGDK